ncbi:MAG: 30S ribosomal protein S7, partial [Candidatus Aenigmatarchaeota archaeon]
EAIEQKKKENPIQVLVKAIENAALYEEITAYQMGGMIARKAVITSPQRRVDLALRLMTQGIYRSTFRSKRKLAEVIASELMAIADNDAKTLPIRERNRIEKEAEGAR